MLYKNSKEWFDAMKEHRCKAKNLISSDDPSNDVWSAKVENRDPVKYPTMGYTCQGCEESFDINLNQASMEILPKEQKEIVSTLIKCSAGRKKLGNYLSGIKE
jgi:hypothetical protein